MKISRIYNKAHKRFSDIWYYFKNRTIYKFHCLTSDLPKGNSYGLDKRILHSLFNELIVFIDVEKGALYRSITKKKTPNDGLLYLYWEIKNGTEEQKSAAIWQLGAYYWWKRIYSTRVTPSELSGLDNYYDTHLDNYSGITEEFINDILHERNDELDALYQKCFEIEQYYHDEETKWLKELIEHRSDLWI